MNTFFPLSHNQKFSNTTSLSNGILKKLAITLAVSAIGMSTLVPIAYAEGEVVAQPGDIITVEDDIYGISGNFADGGTLTVKISGESFADDLRKAAGEDGSIGLDDFFVHVKDYPYSPSAKKFKSLMGDKIDADGNMKVEDILSVVPVFDPEDDLPIADGLTRDEVSTLFNNTFSDKSSPEQIDRYINQLVFNESQNGENVYRGFELESLPLLRTMAENSDADYRYRITALANVADDEGNITYENFQNILPAELFLEENDYYDGDGDNAEDEDDGSDLTIGHQLLAKFQEEATDGKLSLGDAWALTYSDSGYDENDIDEYKTFLNHVGKDLILTKAELDALGVESGAKTDEVNNFWTGLQPHVNDDGKVDITTAMAFLDVTSSANDFLQEGESEFTKWNDDGRVTTQNVAHVVNEAFNQAEYKDPNRSEADFIEPNVDPQKVIAKLGSADANGTYDADAVYDAILDVYMAEWQVDFDDGDQPKLNDIFDSVGNNGRISIDDYISLSGLTGEKETAVRALLETAADDNGEITAYEAYDAGNFDDFILEIYKKTDVDSPLSIDEILDTIPDGVTRENKDAFEEQLEELAGDDGTIARETALDKLTEFVLENPGNELEQIDADGNVIGFQDPNGNNQNGVGIELFGEGELNLNNESDIYSHNNGIFVGSRAADGTFLSEVSVVNSGDINSEGNMIKLWGKNVTLNNSGDLDSFEHFPNQITNAHGITISAEKSITLTNTGELDILVKDEGGAIKARSNSGDVILNNQGDLSVFGNDGKGIEVGTGFNHTINGTTPLKGGAIKVTNSGNIETDGDDSTAIDTWSNGGKIDVTNSGKLTTEKQGSAGIDAYSGTNKTENSRVVQKGDAVKVTNSGVISTEANKSHGIFAGSNGGTVEVDNSQKVTTEGDSSTGIRLSSGQASTSDTYVAQVGGDLTLKNTGDVSTEGDESEALRGWTNGGDISATNEGKIVTGGEESHGIKLSSGNAAKDETTKEQDGGDITLTNKGVIETSGNKTSNIRTYTNGGTTSITNEAKLTATGENSRGIKANSGHEEDGEIVTAGGNITINNTGEIVGTGEGIDGSMGIKAESVADKDQGGDVKIENSGNVTATGGGIGIEAAKNGEMTNSGDITVKGEDSGGLLISAEDTALLTNTGNVEVEGQLGLAALALNSASIDNSGDVSLVRNWSEPESNWNPAIGAYSFNNASIKNSGKVTAEGDNMIGLHAGASDSDTTKKANIENSGDVTTKGNGKAHAVYISLDGTGTLSNTGSLITEGKTNTVVVDGKGDFTLDNAADGVIEAKDGIAIVTEETKDTITNLGTIMGGVDLAAGDDLLDNKGILEGNFNFGDGEDTLNLSDLSKVSAATFDGGASDDVANLSGGGELAKDQIVNFETANFLSGDFSGDVMDKFTKLVNVESGASLSGFTKVNNLTSSGTVSVAAGETLDVNGDLNVEGGTFNIGVDSTSKHAVVNVSGDASFASTSNLFVNVVKDSSLTLDESVTVLNGKTLTFDEIIDSTANEAEEEFDVEDDYISYDFSGRVEKAEKGDQLVLTVRDSIGSVIEDVGEEYGGAIKHIASLSDDKVSEENSVLTELKKKLDEGKTEEAQELMDEVVSSPGASQISSTQNTSSFTAGNMVINRAAARIDGGYTATLSADDSSNILGYNTEYKSAPHIRNIMAMTDEGTEASLAATGYNGEIWMQVYGVYQENSGKVSGKTNVFGGAAGIDFLVSPQTVLGLGLIYSSSDSDADTTNAHTDIETDSFGITAYGMTQLGQGYRLGGSLAYYWNDHDLKRQILTNQMEADYDSTTFVARAELGREFDMGSYTFMPQIGAIYTTNSADAYTETGPLAQAASSTDTNSFIGQVGFVVNSQQEWNGMLVRPELHMNILHEFNDELGTFSGALAADNTVSVSSTITSNENTRYNIGGGLKLNHTTAFASEFGYDGIFADDTQEHLFRYKASYKY